MWSVAQVSFHSSSGNDGHVLLMCERVALMARISQLDSQSGHAYSFQSHDDEGLRMLSLLSVVLLHPDREAVCGQE